MGKILSIIIPVYNESAYIARCLENVINTKLLGWEKEIIVVNDGSNDSTLKILKSLQSKYQIILFSHDSNRGKGASVKTGLRRSTGNVVIIQDADLEYDPNDYIAILQKYSDGSTKAVYGSRITGAKIYHNYSANAIFYLGGITLTKLTNIFFRTNLTDQPTGYKSWSNDNIEELIENCPGDGFEFEIELTYFLAQKTTIQEVPIHYYPRTVSHGKKINVFDFMKSFGAILRCWRKS